jgi:hypothetical protein
MDYAEVCREIQRRRMALTLADVGASGRVEALVTSEQVTSTGTINSLHVREKGAIVACYGDRRRI